MFDFYTENEIKIFSAENRPVGFYTERLSIFTVPFFCAQGVLKMRKRVTLMAVTISVIFVISWGTDGIVHILDNEVGSIKLGPYVIPIAHTILMFNAAVNPYLYAMINERFREKMKRMICCNSTSSTTRVAPATEQQDIEMADNIGNQSSNKSGRTSTE